MVIRVIVRANFIAFFQDGSIYCIFPDLPLLQVPDNNLPFAGMLYIVGKVARAFNLEVLTPKTFYAISIVLLYLFFYFFNAFVSLIWSIVF